MAGLSAPGIGSNLDVNGLVTKLMTLEKRPIQLLDSREASIQQRLSAFGALKGALSSLQTAAEALSSPARFKGFSASVSDSALASVSVGENPAVGSYSLEVQQLAQAHKVKSIAFPSSSQALGTGTITIDIGSYDGGFVQDPDTASITVTVGSGEDALAKVRDAINAANGGATASLVNDGTGTRLVLASKQSGEEHALRVRVTDDDGDNTDALGLSRLAYDSSAPASSQLVDAIAAKDAVAVIDGITVTSATNQLKDVLDGVTLNLTKQDPGKVATLTVGRDTNAAKSAVEQFAKAWNDAAKLMRDLSAYDATNKKGSVLTGDTALSAVQTRLRGVMNAIKPAGGFGSLAELGVTTNKDGTLAVDAGKLATAVADPTKSIAALFATSATPSDARVTVKSTGSLAEAGSYALDITQAATQGSATGSQAAATTITAGVNDTLQLTVDGAVVTVTLGAGSYSAATLAAEIRAKVNGTLSTGAIDVTESAGVLSIASRAYGSASTVLVSGGNAATDLFGTATSTAGLDVAGTIGGVVGTGTGRTLAASGFVLEVAATSSGALGGLTYATGFAGLLNQVVTDLLGERGPLRARTDSLDATVKQLGERREALNLRLELTEKRYRAQFNALDLSLARMQSTSSWLTTQLANLPRVRRVTHNEKDYPVINPFKRGAAAYAEVAVETDVASADPHQLIVLLYDGALRAIAQAEAAIASGNVQAKGECVSKAIQIVEEGLKASLDERVGGELAQQLRSLYEYMARRLLFASVRNDPAGLREVAGLLADLKSAWQSIGTTAPAPGRMAA